MGLTRFMLGFILTLSFLASGCSTLADARNAEGQGIKRTYSANFETVWGAAIKSLSDLKLDLASENKTSGYLLAQRGMGLFQMSYGENVAIFLKPKGSESTDVEVVSKKVMATNIFAPNWSEDVHKGIQNNLKK